jgi:hypothetical protein
MFKFDDDDDDDDRSNHVRYSNKLHDLAAVTTDEAAKREWLLTH